MDSIKIRTMLFAFFFPVLARMLQSLSQQCQEWLHILLCHIIIIMWIRSAHLDSAQDSVYIHKMGNLITNKNYDSKMLKMQASRIQKVKIIRREMRGHISYLARCTPPFKAIELIQNSCCEIISTCAKIERGTFLYDGVVISRLSFAETCSTCPYETLLCC